MNKFFPTAVLGLSLVMFSSAVPIAMQRDVTIEDIQSGRVKAPEKIIVRNGVRHHVQQLCRCEQAAELLSKSTCPPGEECHQADDLDKDACPPSTHPVCSCLSGKKIACHDDNKDEELLNYFDFHKPRAIPTRRRKLPRRTGKVHSMKDFQAVVTEERPKPAKVTVTVSMPPPAAENETAKDFPTHSNEILGLENLQQDINVHVVGKGGSVLSNAGMIASQ